MAETKKNYKDPHFKDDLTSFCKQDQMKEEYVLYDFMRASKMSSFTDEEGDLAVGLDDIKPYQIAEPLQNTALFSVL